MNSLYPNSQFIQSNLKPLKSIAKVTCMYKILSLPNVQSIHVQSMYNEDIIVDKKVHSQVFLESLGLPFFKVALGVYKQPEKSSYSASSLIYFLLFSFNIPYFDAIIYSKF